MGIQYQQGLKDLVPASDLAEGLLNNVDRPPVYDREGRVELYAGKPLPHFNEVDEGVAVDAPGVRYVPVDGELELPAPIEGNAYVSDAEHVPSNIYEARDAFAASDVAREAFGAEVVDHYLNRARVEITAFEAAVTDWERYRGFERL